MQDSKGNRFILERSGLSQSHRNSAMLDGDYFRIDNKSTSDLIKFILEFADNLVYYNIDNQPDGTFRSVLEGDDTIDIIMLASFKTKDLEKEYKNHLQEYLKTQNHEPLCRFLIAQFFQILNWNNAFEQSQNIKNEIKRFTENEVVKVFTVFYNYCKSESEVLIAKLNLFPPSWHQAKPILIESKDKVKLMNRIFGSVLSLLNEMVEIGKVYQKIRLNEFQKINPQIALLLTYLDLFTEAQKELNNQTSRHLKYYYSEVLNIDRKKTIPDKVYLFPVVSQNKSEFAIPKETVFLAGKEVKYKTDREFVVSKVSCDSFKAICRDQVAAQENNKSLIEYYHIPDKYIPETASAGYSKNTLGWAISHPSLNLHEGTRKVRFKFVLERFSMHLLKRRLANLAEMGSGDEILQHALSVKHSTNEDWNTLDEDQTETKIIKDADGIEKLAIDLLLYETSQPIAPFLKEFQQDIVAKDPIVMFRVNPQNPSLSNIFFDLVYTHLSFEIDVLGISSLALQNDFGPLDQATPFLPFGPTPTIGSSFLIGHPTIFTAPLKELFVNINWFNIPDNDNGFSEHYKGYSYIDSNQVFKCKLSMLNEKIWQPDEDNQMINLFEDVEMEESPELSPINDFRGIDNIEIDKINVAKPNPIGFNQQVKKSQSGWLKMELCYPPNGFGYKEYGELVKKGISEGVKSKKIVMPPNEPWMPQMKSISIDYSTEIHFDFSGMNKLFHIHPYGVENIRLGRKKQIQFLPLTYQGGELFIGISKVKPPQVFNIFFKLSDYISDFLPEDRHYQWSVLNGGKWELLEQNQILEDETHGFIQSGYIALDLNQKIDINSGGILPEGLLWLKLSVNTSINFFQNILDIRSEAIVAHFYPEASEGTGRIEANQITGTEKYISGIDNILQPYPSFGGRGAENYNQYINRVSERLHHKNRSSSFWDFEHIILEEFPDINRVKCLPNTTIDLQSKPGHVLNVVVPNVQTLNNNSHIPAFPQNHLEKIKRHLEQTSSPFANIEVVNPKYEEIKLKFNVKFNKGLNYRHYSEVLQQELIKFLNPWLNNAQSQLDFGVSIKGASIIYFIEKLPYVNVITNLTVLQVIGKRIVPRDLTKSSNITIEPSTPISIFISSNKHIIQVISDEVEETGGLEDMSLGNDFIIEAYDNAYSEVNQGIENYTLGVDFILPEDEDNLESKEDCFLQLKNKNHG